MKGYSLHIGLNYVDPNHYGGWNGKLNACEYDAYDMQAICKSLNYITTSLIGDKATRDNVIKSLKKLSKQLTKDDILYVSYSGHGGQVPDYNSDEADTLDETWCLFDGQLIDDELKKLWSLFEEGVRIFVTSDSCHSGDVVKAANFDNNHVNLEGMNTNPKFMPSEIAARTFYQNKNFYDNIIKSLISEAVITVKASVKLISGCQTDEFSYDGTYNGVFTAHLKKIWNGGKFKGNYAQFHHKIVVSIISAQGNQTPNIMDIGTPNIVFDSQKPYHI